ncbi:hypothetical protein O6P43_001200 [Quillaja saponaria]|uniref:Uncharacterized protein n=1 Tax=Quillaja saponaria TaxID=32244 RepID=A0AAD7QIL3_QUISA|nr:hypothetical protein O6P43_001200 [Quillaja saponaria]
MTMSVLSSLDKYLNSCLAKRNLSVWSCYLHSSSVTKLKHIDQLWQQISSNILQAPCSVEATDEMQIETSSKLILHKKSCEDAKPKLTVLLVPKR